MGRNKPDRVRIWASCEPIIREELDYIKKVVGIRSDGQAIAESIHYYCQHIEKTRGQK